MTPTPPQAHIHDITDVTSWAASLARAGASRDPREVAIFQATKAALLASLTDEDNHTSTTQDQS